MAVERLRVSTYHIKFAAAGPVLPVVPGRLDRDSGSDLDSRSETNFMTRVWIRGQRLVTRTSISQKESQPSVVVTLRMLN